MMDTNQKPNGIGVTDSREAEIVTSETYLVQVNAHMAQYRSASYEQRTQIEKEIGSIVTEASTRLSPDELAKLHDELRLRIKALEEEVNTMSRLEWIGGRTRDAARVVLQSADVTIQGAGEYGSRILGSLIYALKQLVWRLASAIAKPIPSA